MSKRNREIVRIENPRPGESSYTSAKAAHRHCLRRVAEWATPTSIRFVDRAELDRLALARMDWDREQSILRNRKGVIFWNGCDTQTGAMHLPFTAPMFPRAGSGSISSQRLWADRLGLAIA